jgi:hypothetical protein
VLKAVSKQVSSQRSEVRGFDTDLDVPGRKGGKATVSGAYTGNERNGVIDFQGFLNRLGFPMFESGAIRYDLDIQPSSIKGTLSATNLRIKLQGSIRQVSFNANYNLVLESGLWNGGVTGEVSVDGEEEEFDIDYDTPILLALEAIPLNSKGEEEPGTTMVAGKKVRIRLWVNSNAPVNWVNSSWESPSKNLEGGGSGQGYCRYGKCSDSLQPWNFAEVDVGYWIWYRDYTISEYQEPGEYSWAMSVKNGAELTSRTLTATMQVQNPNYTAQKPTIVDVRLETSGTTSGAGASSTVTILAQSAAPVTWLSRGFEGPAGNIYGGGSGFSFESCADYLATDGHICDGRDSGHYFTTFTDTISRWAPNGVYTYTGISVENEANLASDEYTGTLSFTVSGNAVAVTPTITSVQMVTYTSGEDPIISGIPLNGECIAASLASDPLPIALIVTASSNAPVDWVNLSFYGPSGNLSGGGFGASFEEVSPGVWRYVLTSSVQSPLYAPKGTYYFDGISVKNEGQKTSSAYAGALSFLLLNGCP